MDTSQTRQSVTIVSGLPRSGTSLMMQMLQAGGVELITDAQRPTDADNPLGYFEFEAVKKTRQDPGWLAASVTLRGTPPEYGRAVKMVSMLLYDLPGQYDYRVIFMQREMAEILASQRAMLVRRQGVPLEPANDSDLERAFRTHLIHVNTWLARQPNFTMLYVHYGELMTHPGPVVQQIDRFVGPGLNTQAMIQVIDPSLHRQRAGEGSKK